MTFYRSAMLKMYIFVKKFPLNYAKRGELISF